MKMFVIALMSLTTATVFAKTKTCTMSLEQIQADRYLQTEMPKIQFGTVFVSVDGVCVAGDQLKTISPVAVCTKFATGELGQCVAETSVTLSTPIAFTKEIVKNETSFETITVKHATSYEIAVGYAVESGLQVVCKKTLTLPSCQ